MTTYAEHLQEFISGSKLTQKQLAERTEVSQPTIHRFISGTRFPDASFARKVDVISEGQLPFWRWQADARVRFGIDEKVTAA